MKKRFTQEQIIGVLKEAEAGMKVAEVCRKHASATRRTTTGSPSLAG